jgi:hypothetical protein
MKRVLGLGLALIMGCLPSAFAQTASGNIYGTVNDQSGAMLPGAAVKLTSPVGNRETTSGPQGDFRFLNLDHGSYELTVTLSGFSTVKRSVEVNVGENVNLNFQLKLAQVQEMITVTTETPVVDVKKVGTSLTLSKEEMAQIPSARDPWAMLRAVPGIIMDRVNVAGNENGQQAAFVGKGDSGANTMWNLDGVVITDTGSLSSPGYYDFDAFDEVAVGTGGNDVRAQTGGININLTTRRGTNAFHGSVHDYLTDHKLGSSNLPAELQNDPRLQSPFYNTATDSIKGDHIQELSDYGADLGGPIVKDKLWFYGSWGRQDIRVQRINGTRDKTKLTSYNGKVNWQAGPQDMVSLFVFNSEKTKEGRPVGISGVTEGDDFEWNQGSKYVNSFSPLHGIVKGEINHTFNPDFFASIKYSHFDTGFFLHPRGGDVNGTIDFFNGVTHGTYLRVDNTRPAQTVNVDANYFKSAWGGNHEFKFGFGFRKFNVSTTTHWGGNGLEGYIFGPGQAYVHVTRDAQNNTEAKYYSGYVADTFTKDRVTINAGVRYDFQKADALPSTAPASASFPSILPALVYDGTTHAGPLPNSIEWKNFSPRVGVTLALDDARKTVARASYAYYASQLPSGSASFVSPIVSPGSYFAYVWNDLNGDGLAQPNEVRTDLGVQYFNYVNPTDPSGPSPNKINSNYTAKWDHEAIIGLERELVANVAVSAAYTWRRGGNGYTWTPRLGFTSADYTPTVFVGSGKGAGYTATGYAPDPALVTAFNGGRILENRPGWHTVFNGAELSVIKRLSNNWMGRVAFTYNDPKEYFDDLSTAVSDPTRSDSIGTGTLSGPQINGGIVAPRSSGSGKGDIFIGAKWQVVANALVQLPWTLELSGAFFARQGQPRPIEATKTLGLDGQVRVLADGTALDTVRYPSVYDLDLRLAKNVKLGTTSLVISGDLFNVFNSNTELNRTRNFTSSAFGRLNEVLSPRILRLGVRYQF